MTETGLLSEWIEEFHKGTLQGRELRLFLREMEKDPDLALEVKLEGLLDSSLTDSDLLDFRKMIMGVRKGPEARIRPGFLMMAAAIILLIGIAGGLFYLLNPKPVSYPPGEETSGGHGNHEKPYGTLEDLRLTGMDDPQAVLSPPAGNGPATQKLKPEDRFVPLLYLEALAGESVRSSNAGVIAPAMNHVYEKGQHIEFRFTPAFRIPTSIEILDNLGTLKQVLKPGPGGSCTLTDTTLPRGLYYWKALREDNLVFVGKFYIGRLP